MRLVYIAHPLGSDPEQRALNLANAARWCAWAAVEHHVSPVASWIVLASILSEDFRDLGLRCDVACAIRCDELWLVGGRISPGMEIEAAAARAAGVLVVDKTHLGYEAPPF